MSYAYWGTVIYSDRASVQSANVSSLTLIWLARLLKEVTSGAIQEQLLLDQENLLFTE